MMQHNLTQEPFEKTSNVIVWLVIIGLMTVCHYMWWMHGEKYEADTGLVEYFYYVANTCYNWLLT